MKSIIARDICTHNVVRAEAESRLGDMLAEIHMTQFTHAAVFEGELFSGVMSLHSAILGNSQRIFADLISQYSLPAVSSLTPIDDIGRILQFFSPDGVGVTDENGVFEGIVTKEDLLGVLLAESRNRLDEICRLKNQQEHFRLLGQMSSAMVHELNNILMAVLGNLELLKTDDGFDEEERKGFITSANTAARDAANAVHRFQSFYVPAKMNDNMQSMDLSEIVRDVMKFTQPKWRDEAQKNGKAIELILDLLPAPFIRGNAGEIREVITNLVLNAVDAITADGIIRIKVYTRDNFTVVEVSDTGIGMDKQQTKRCFEPFFTTKANSSGTGLGLSICSNIIRDLCGRIELDSAPGEGSSFRIFFPADESIIQKDEKNNTPLLPWKILLVDDEPEVCTVIGKMLSVLGQEVDTAASSGEALDLFRKHKYDLVINDQNLPMMSGYELTLEIKKNKPLIPIVMITGWDNSFILNSSIPENNPNLIIEKPVTLETLRELLEKLQS